MKPDFVELLKKELLLSFWNWSIINILCFELFIPMVKLNELCMREGSVANCILCNYGMDGCLATRWLNSQYSTPFELKTLNITQDSLFSWGTNLPQGAIHFHMNFSVSTVVYILKSYEALLIFWNIWNAYVKLWTQLNRLPENCHFQLVRMFWHFYKIFAKFSQTVLVICIFPCQAKLTHFKICWYIIMPNQKGNRVNTFTV